MTVSRPALCGALLLACAATWAQPAPQPSAAASAAERAQKESDRTMYWIRVLADKPAPVRAAPVPKAVAAAAAPSARASAPEPREKLRVATAPTSVAANAAGVGPGRDLVAMAARVPETAQASFADTPDLIVPHGNGVDSGAAVEALLPAELPPPVEPDPGLTQIRSVQPDFPPNVVKRVRKGNVEVKFEVDPGGKVVDAAVVESSHPRLNDAAVDAIKQWRFKPTPKAHVALVNLVFDIDNQK